jgi:hypothetical protein
MFSVSFVELCYCFWETPQTSKNSETKALIKGAAQFLFFPTHLRCKMLLWPICKDVIRQEHPKKMIAWAWTKAVSSRACALEGICVKSRGPEMSINNVRDISPAWGIDPCSMNHCVCTCLNPLSTIEMKSNFCAFQDFFLRLRFLGQYCTKQPMTWESILQQMIMKLGMYEFIVPPEAILEEYIVIPSIL